MTLKRTPRSRDPIQLGKLMVDIATGQVPNAVDDGINATAASKGRAGGRSRAGILTPERRAEIARQGAKTRWKAPSDA